MHLTRGRYCTTKKTLTELNIGSKNVGVIHERPFFHRLFSMKFDGIFKNCSCFIDYRLLMLYRILLDFCVWQETILHKWLRCQNQNLFKNLGIISDWPFLFWHFCMKIDIIFMNCSCFIDYRRLMLYRILLNFCVWQETVLHNMTTLSE